MTEGSHANGASVCDVNNDDPASLSLARMLVLIGKCKSDLRHGSGGWAGGVGNQVHFLVVDEDCVVSANGRDIGH